MLIKIRPIAISAAVVSFFGLSLYMLSIGLTPLTCCKRALIGAAIAYIATTIAVKIINAILTNAIIESHINRPEE